MTHNSDLERKKGSTARRRFLGVVATGVAGTGALAFGAMPFGNREGWAARCRIYPSEQDLRQRKAAIAKILNSADPEETAAWVVGVGEAESSIKKEIEEQVHCLTQAAADSAGVDATSIVVSHVRDAATQRTIWDRKYDFLRKEEGGAGPFGIITEAVRSAYPDELGSARQWHPDKKKHRAVWANLSPEQRQTEILQTSTAPGVSRHHWGSDVDLFGTTPADWSDTGPMADKYAWLQQNAERHGFIQPYTAASAQEHPAITEERWHWSYYPVSDAVLDFIRANSDAIVDHLEKLWSYDPSRYTYIRENWQNYVSHVSSLDSFSS